MGCRVNGTIWVSASKGNQGGTFSELQYAQDTLGINIYGDNAQRGDGITLSFYDSPTLQSGKQYDLTSFFAEYVNNQACFYDSVVSGSIQLIAFDKDRQIIAGTFEAKLYSPKCKDLIAITDGRFDLKFNY